MATTHPPLQSSGFTLLVLIVNPRRGDCTRPPRALGMQANNVHRPRRTRYVTTGWHMCPFRWRDLDPYLIHRLPWALHEPAVPKRAHDRFSHFCTAHPHIRTDYCTCDASTHSGPKNSKHIPWWLRLLFVSVYLPRLPSSASPSSATTPTIP